MSKLSSWQEKLPDKAAHVLVPGGGVLVAASAVAALAWSELEHRRLRSADLTASGLKVETLWEIRDDRGRLAEIEERLREEWGEFALLGFESVEKMAAIAGRYVLVASEREGDGYRARGALQTTLVDVGGDAHKLAEQYPSFADLTRPGVWRRAFKRGGDTAVLLQITTFGSGERGAGLGSLLRNAALHMQDRDVRFALTTTPVDGAGQPDLADRATYTPAMRFHARGGAEPAALLPGYKTGEAAASGSRHGTDVVVMRYARDAEGAWPAPKPEMRVHLVGPLQERVTRTARRLARVPARGCVALGELRRGAAASRGALHLPRLRRRAEKAAA